MSAEAPRSANPSVSSGRRSVVLLLVLLAAGVGWLHARRDLPWGIWDTDSRQYADVARHLVNGQGFSTGIVYPAALPFGAEVDHPSLLVPPLWPLVLAGSFLVSGEAEWAGHLATLVLHLAGALAASLLALHLSGLTAAAVSGAAAGLSPAVLLYATGTMTEPAFAFLVTLVFLLAAMGCGAFWVGAACGLAMLTRHNGVLLAPVALALLVQRPIVPASLLLLALRFGLGWALVLSPWWIRNFAVTGDPFFSFSEAYLHFGTGLTHGGSLLHYVDPEVGRASALIADPWDKAPGQLLAVLGAWPPAGLALPALLGLGIGCVRRERFSWGVLAVLGLNTVLLALTVPNGRYLVPFLPVLFAVGSAAWHRLGGRLGAVGLGLVLATPWLPVWLQTRDIAYGQRMVEAMRSDPTHAAELARRSAALRRCVAPGQRVVALDAPWVAWEAQAVAIFVPVTRAGFQSVVDRHRVDWVQITPDHPFVSEGFRERFRPRPDCLPDLFERRGELPAE